MGRTKILSILLLISFFFAIDNVAAGEITIDVRGKACPFFADNYNASTSGDSYQLNYPVVVTIPKTVHNLAFEVTGRIAKDTLQNNLII